MQAPSNHTSRLSVPGRGIASRLGGSGPGSVLPTLLRGVGQVMLQNNAWAGLIFLLGIFYHSALFAGAVVVGTGVSTATALLLGVDRDLIRDGLFGFNGALVLSWWCGCSCLPHRCSHACVRRPDSRMPTTMRAHRALIGDNCRDKPRRLCAMQPLIPGDLCPTP